MVLNGIERKRYVTERRAFQKECFQFVQQLTLKNSDVLVKQLH